MTKITTEDCKNFIKEHFGLTSTVNIKRDRKYKDGNGDVIREFSIEGYANCFIRENKNGDLSIINADEIVAKSVESEGLKEFNAKKFIKKNIKRLENDEGDDEEEAMAIFMKETARLSLEDKVKVANEFYFYFPYETYNNMSKFITNGLDTPMLIDGKDSLCIVFYDSLDSEPDLYVSDILKEILPEYFDKVDEYHFEVDSNDFTKKLSITDMLELLQHYGFTYKNSTEYLDTNGCMLKKLNLK
jgi:hypothetical protein